MKVEATRFTEVGYVGKDVEQIIRDLMPTAVKLHRAWPAARACAGRERAEERILDALLPPTRGRARRSASTRRATTIDIGAEPSSQASSTGRSCASNYVGELDAREISWTSDEHRHRHHGPGMEELGQQLRPDVRQMAAANRTRKR